MSNLTLPRMTYVTLKGMLNNARLKNRSEVKLAYATTAEYTGGENTITIRHHGNAIAMLTPEHIHLTGSGWNSQTTATRLRTILNDNQTVLAENFGRTYYSVTSRDNQREYGLFLTGTTRDPNWETHNLRDIQFGWVTFHKSESGHFVLSD